MRWSIRWRLALWNTLALAVLLACFAALIYALLARFLCDGVDRSLADAWRQLDRDPRAAGEAARLSYWVEEFWEHEHIACAVYDRGGRVLARTPELAADAVPGAPPAAADAPSFASAALPIVGRQRTLTARLPHADDGRTVVLMAGLAETDHALGHLRTALLAAVPVMLLLSALAAYL